MNPYPSTAARPAAGRFPGDARTSALRAILDLRRRPAFVQSRILALVVYCTCNAARGVDTEFVERSS